MCVHHVPPIFKWLAAVLMIFKQLVRQVTTEILNGEITPTFNRSIFQSCSKSETFENILSPELLCTTLNRIKCI